jgi:hypothetical protein
MSPRCPNCAAEVPPDATPGGACAACGKPFPDALFARLPAPEPDGPTLPVDDTPFQYCYPVRFALVAAVVAAVGFGVAFPFGVGPRVVSGCILGVALVTCVGFLLLNATSAKRLNRDLLALQSGGHVARWEYSSAEWLRFVAADWRRGKRWAGVPVVGLVVTVGAAVMLPRDTEGDREGIAAAVCGGMGIVLVGGGMLASAWRTYRTRREKVGVAFIGHGLACVGGRCALWGRGGWSLSTVRVTDGNPSVLELLVGTDESAAPFRVPIPRGRENEARRLVSVLMNGG